jgi:hypothetical protein
VVSAKRVVAVAALLQNSVAGVLCESSGCAQNSPDMYVKCPFLSGPDVLVLPEKDEAVLQKDAGPFKKGPDVFYRCRNPLPFPFFPISLLICAPARPRVNIIMCVHFPSSGVRLKNMSYNISLYQSVTNKFQKSSGKTVRYVWLLS